MKRTTAIAKREEVFHDNWAKQINPNDLCVLEAFEGPVSPEYTEAVKCLGKLKGKNVLNPGCGAGEEAVYLAQHGAKVWAVDISAGMLRVAKKLARKFKMKKSITFKQENVEALSFPDGQFDRIFGNSVLHHVTIEETVPQFHRILKKNGKAIFIEPLAYNPIINYYRKIADTVRTPDEHPLKFSDIAVFSRYFKEVKHYEFQLLTLLVFCSFFLIERIHPNKDRYWKKVIREGKKYAPFFRILSLLDKVILTFIPFLRRYCWVTVIEAEK